MKKYSVTFTFSNQQTWNEVQKSTKENCYGAMSFYAPNDRTALKIAESLCANCESWEINRIESTCVLVQELATREGVQHIKVEPHVPIKVEVDGKNVGEIKSGPCHILVVYD